MKNIFYRPLPANWLRGVAVTLAAVCVALSSPALQAAEKKAKAAAKTTVTPAPRRAWQFPEDGVTFDSQFNGARLSECRRLGANEYAVVTLPENTPINQSAWFAFKASAATPRTITVRLNCSGAPLRYTPKISLDGIVWIELPKEAFQTGPKEDEGTLKLELGTEPIWLAAQELMTTERMDAWGRTLERLPFVTRSEIGKSMGGRPMYKIDITGESKQPGYVIIIGRQHPPEVTGSLALMHCVETLVGDSDLARAFRKEFNVLLVPLLNPDGVDGGHWRHNLGGVDLNRDWGIFAQPETRIVSEQILALPKKGRVFLHLDFHSTRQDVFYTQPDDEPASPAGFTKPWIDAIQKRFPAYKVNRTSTRVPNPTTSHNWSHKTLGIPAITYEIGDETDRALLQQISTGAAEEMMKLLLELKRSGK
jgi:hypothetical protein